MQQKSTWIVVSAIALALVACKAEEDPAPNNANPFAGTGAVAGTAGTAGGAGVAGQAVAGTGGVGVSGTGGVAGTASTAGSGGVAGTGTAGTMAAGTGGAPAVHPVCGMYTCGNLAGVGEVCVTSTGLPPTCTVGGTECAAFMGSNCVMSPSGTYCIKGCGAPGAMMCPMNTTCMDPFAMGGFCAANGTTFPPTCTPGGTECMAYGTPCSMIAGINGCWKTCTP